MLVKTTSWNPNAKFLVVIDWLERDWKKFVKFIFTAFWRHFVINVTINIPPNDTFADTKVKQKI